MCRFFEEEAYLLGGLGHEPSDGAHLIHPDDEVTDDVRHTLDQPSSRQEAISTESR
jgi:hypothetical protein